MSGFRLPGLRVPPVRRFALLIGAKDYEGAAALTTPLEDIRLVRSTLEARSFVCTSLEDPTLAEIADAVSDFAVQIHQADLAVLYFSGHAYEHMGHGAILPTDFPFPPDGENLHYAAYPVSGLEEAFRDCRGVGVLVLDACRVALPPMEANRWTQIGVRHPTPTADQTRLLVAWSTSAGAPAWDGADGTSRYAAAFGELAPDHELDLGDLCAKIGSAVDKGAQAQHSWIRSGLRDRIFLTDLTRYDRTVAVQTPLRAELHSPMFLARPPDGSRVLAGGKNRALWSIGVDDAVPAHEATLPDAALAADVLADRVLVADEGRGLRLLTRDGPRTCVLGEKDCHGLKMSPDGAFAVAYGSNWLSIIDMNDGPTVRSRITMPFDPYGAIFADDQTAWIVGAGGGVARTDLRTGALAEVTERSPYVDHLYDVCVLEDGDLVIAGGSGTVRRCRPRHSPPALLTRRSKVGYGGGPPPAGNGDLGLDEIWIGAFGTSEILFCDVSPAGPLLAAGAATGEIFAIDLRDGRLAASWAARAPDKTLQGLVVLKDGTISALHGDGVVTLARPVR